MFFNILQILREDNKNSFSLPIPFFFILINAICLQNDSRHEIDTIKCERMLFWG